MIICFRIALKETGIFESLASCFAFGRSASLNMTALLSGLISHSLSDAKLAEYRIENLFHIHDADDFADCAQCLVQIDRNVTLRIIPRPSSCGRDRSIPEHGEDNRDVEY